MPEPVLQFVEVELAGEVEEALLEAGLTMILGVENGLVVDRGADLFEEEVEELAGGEIAEGFGEVGFGVAAEGGNGVGAGLLCEVGSAWVTLRKMADLVVSADEQFGSARSKVRGFSLRSG